MKNTKVRILETSLALFNTYGLAKVTLRTIAKEMGISQGNLNYHFKKREDIITALYFQLVENINEKMAQTAQTPNTLPLLFGISEAVMVNFYEYRFFLLDFVQIIREHPTIKAHYQELSKTREKQFMDLFRLMIKNGMMKKESLPNEYLHLYKRFQILGDFWLSAATIQQPLSKELITEYTQIIHQMIFPYLTAKGKKEFLMLTQKGNLA